ncbi:MAG: protease complex subunit PrcB family protein [Proteobacteria bacterium]|nr:protease complex subunit PrcB family protein [Pseudomonadota bacterium]
MGQAQRLRYLISLSLVWIFSATATASEPDIHLVEYQAFRPNLDFGLNDGPDTATFTAIQSLREWKTLWSQIEPRMAREMSQQGPHAFPSIDFTRNTLLVAALGSKPTGGYAVAIHSVVEYPTSITVNVIAQSPAKDCVLTMAETHPIVLVLIPRMPKPIEFSTTHAVHTCG